jgi:CheY-like chemotaxis protein
MNLVPVKILLADDDLDDCLFFQNALKELHLSTNLTIVNDGTELMNYLKTNISNIPDVLFLDINMPRKNGLECLYEIRKEVIFIDLPIIIFSTSNSRDKINQVFRTGGHVYIRKPADFNQLKQLILNALPIATDKLYSKGPIKYILNA